LAADYGLFSVGEKEREFIPVGVKTDVTKVESEEKAESNKPGEPVKGTVKAASDQ
jgi:hypothetical protein